MRHTNRTKLYPHWFLNISPYPELWIVSYFVLPLTGTILAAELISLQLEWLPVDSLATATVTAIKFLTKIPSYLKSPFFSSRLKMLIFCKVKLLYFLILFDIVVQIFFHRYIKFFINFILLSPFFNLTSFPPVWNPADYFWKLPFYTFPSRQATPEICKWEISFSANGSTLTTYSFLTLFPQKPPELVNFKQSYLNNLMFLT